MTTLTIISRPGCHLCAVAHEIVEQVVAELPEDDVDVEEFSILDDPGLYDLWWDKIPVVLVDGHLHAQWRLSPDRLRAALIAAPGEGRS
ncbi:glutaredoxin family protein [Microbacterium sp.]|uniref:glutaredoxin family protein n=1 Tax=Microbacterium sp. TaxID=51671 RepID=UPI0025F53EDB|nr:glutaredoxin family protein [Microbacterium sp.]